MATSIMRDLTSKQLQHVSNVSSCRFIRDTCFYFIKLHLNNDNGFSMLQEDIVIKGAGTCCRIVGGPINPNAVACLTKHNLSVDITSDQVSEVYSL